jgi:hypothetical protein
MRGNLKALSLFDSPRQPLHALPYLLHPCSRHPTPLQQEREIFLNLMAVTLERGNDKAAYLFPDDPPLGRIVSVTSLPIPR